MTMKTFRTEEEARKAGFRPCPRPLTWMAYGSEALTQYTCRSIPARILSPETLACVEALEAVEWQDADDYTFCPYCCRQREEGHLPTCKLDLALREVGVR